MWQLWIFLYSEVVKLCLIFLYSGILVKVSNVFIQWNSKIVSFMSEIKIFVAAEAPRKGFLLCRLYI